MVVYLADADAHPFGVKTAKEVFIFLLEQATEDTLDLDMK